MTDQYRAVSNQVFFTAPADVDTQGELLIAETNTESWAWHIAAAMNAFAKPHILT